MAAETGAAARPSAPDAVRKSRPPTTLQVVESSWLTPHMIRIVLGGPEFENFSNNAFTDRYVKLVFRKPGVDYPEPFDMRTVRSELPSEDWPTTRTYTVRWVDEAARRLAIDFVYHGDEGVAAKWAAAARPGDELMFSGPGGAYSPRTDADWHLLAGDETAIPAIAAALEDLPATARATVLIEVEDATEEQELRSAATVDLRWLHRSGRADRPGSALVAALQALEFPAGDADVFVHGELASIREIRTDFFDRRGLAKDKVSISGYWRDGKNEDGFQAEKRAEAAAERERVGVSN